jgi:hypothetical protein
VVISTRLVPASDNPTAASSSSLSGSSPRVLRLSRIRKVIEHPLCFAIGKHGVKERPTPVRDARRDSSGSLVVNLGCVLNRVHLEIPLPISLRLDIKRGNEFPGSRRLYPAAMI